MVPLQLGQRILLSVFGAAILVLPSFAAARDYAPIYKLTDLGFLPDSSESIGVQLNDRGCAIGIAIGANNKGVLFQKGKVIDLDPSSESSDVSGINAENQVTGSFYDGARWDGYVYDHGKFTVLEAPGSIETYPESLNDLGQIAGSYQDAASKDHIFVRQANGRFQDLGSNFGIDPDVLAINDQGRVLIGTYDEPQGHTYLSRPGTTSVEEVPSLIANGWVSPGDMNKWGMVVGSAAVDPLNQRQHAYLYFEGKITDLGLLPGGDSTVGNAVNNFGQTVGSAYQFSKRILDPTGKIIGSTPEIDHGWVRLDGRMRDLNDLLGGAAKGWEIVDARSINDRGEILADASFAGEPGTRAVLLTPNNFLPCCR
jgi:uncharacterized membrane protein